MSHLEKIRAAVYRTVDAVNDLLPPEEALEASDDLVLIGKNGGLDSMGFVNFVVALEEELERELGGDLNIEDLLNIQTESGTTVADLIKMLVERLG
jgi:acyl carrier protein